MSQKNETTVLILSLLITAGIVGGGYWWLTRKSAVNSNGLSSANQNDSPTTRPTETLPPPTSPSAVATFNPPSQVPGGTIVKINGSTSMVQINQSLKNSFEQRFPGTQVVTNAQGSDRGIQSLLSGESDVAAISRPLTSQEQEQGLVAIPVAKDAIAIVVGIDNPFRRGLNQNQVVDIFQGKITNWSAVGGNNGTIRVINRPPISGTRSTFQELVLQGGNFGTSPNMIAMERDATTPILQALGEDGISYATYTQVANQKTVRTVAIDGLTPEAANYPYQRTLYYVYKNPANSAVRAFLGYATSPLGQEVVANGQ